MMSSHPNAAAGPSRPQTKLNPQSAVFFAPPEQHHQQLQPPFPPYDRPIHHHPSPGVQHQSVASRPPINHLYSGPQPTPAYFQNGYGQDYAQQQQFGGYQNGRVMGPGWGGEVGVGGGYYHSPYQNHNHHNHYNNNNNNNNNNHYNNNNTNNNHVQFHQNQHSQPHHHHHQQNQARMNHHQGVYFPVHNGPPIPFLSPPPPPTTNLAPINGHRSPSASTAHSTIIPPSPSHSAAPTTVHTSPSLRSASLGPAPPLVPTPEVKPGPEPASINFTPDHDQPPPTPPTFAPPPARSSGKRVKPPLPRNAEPLSFGPNVRPPPGSIATNKPVPVSSVASSAKGEDKPTPVPTPAPAAAEPAVTTAAAVTTEKEVHVEQPATEGAVTGEDVADAALKAGVLEVPALDIKDVVSSSATNTVVSSSPSSPVLAPASPTTTATTVEAPTVPSTPKAAEAAAPAASTSSTPTPASAPVKAQPKKSWADLVRSPNSGPAPVNANGTTATPITEHVPASAAHKPVSSGPGGKKTLAQSLEGVETNFTAPTLTPRGLVNNGNLCFANAILQVLVYTAPFWNLLATIKRETNLDLSGQTPSLDAMVIFLEEFRAVNKVSVVKHRSKASGSGVPVAAAEPPSTAELSALAADLGSNDPFAPEQVYESLKANDRFDPMTRGTQEDAEEFLGFFLDTLHEEVLATIDRVDKGKGAASKAQPEEEADSWTEVGVKGRTATTRTTETRDSPITKIFGGQLRSLLRCPGQKDSITLEPYQRLQLDIQPDHVRTIEDALANLVIPEPLPDYTSRGIRVDATKLVLLESCPPVLVLHLKRFLYNHVGGVQKSSKRVGYSTELEIGPELLSSAGRRGKKGGVKYSLYGVVYHHGVSASGGHYTVAVRQQRDANSWLEIDDTSVRPISQGDVVVAPSNGKKTDGAGYQDPYLLLYNRVD